MIYLDHLDTYPDRYWRGPINGDDDDKVRSPEELAEVVAKSAVLLDHEHEGWADLISVDTLDLASPFRCVLGQIARALIGNDGSFGKIALTRSQADLVCPGPNVLSQLYMGHGEAIERGFDLRPSEYARQSRQSGTSAILDALWAGEIRQRQGQE